MEFWMLCAPAKRRSLHVRTWFLFPYRGIVFVFFCVCALWNFIWLSAFVQDMHGLVSKDIDIFKCVCVCVRVPHISGLCFLMCVYVFEPRFVFEPPNYVAAGMVSSCGELLSVSSADSPSHCAICVHLWWFAIIACFFFFKPVNFNSRKEQKCPLACSVASVYPLPTRSSWAPTCVLKRLERGV